MMTTTYYHLPTIEYTPIDCVNRMSVATGSPRYAQASAHADFNGHRLTVQKNLRGYYTCEYFWAGRRVMARSHSILECLVEAVAYYRKGALGSSVEVVLNGEELSDVVRNYLGTNFVAGENPKVETLPWWTWRHDVAHQSSCYGGYVFDWDLLQAASSKDEYRAAVKTKHGRNALNMVQR